MRRSAQLFGAIIASLACAIAILGAAALREDRGGILAVSFLDVGQGDAIFIEAPSGRQVLVDGGANGVVALELARVMPWYDRSIDVVIATHPDQDHIGGLIDALSRYSIGTIVESSVQDVEGSDSRGFAAAAAAESAKRIVASRGQIVDLGDGAYIEILFPDRVVESVETNTGAIVARLVYGDTAFMLTSDSPRSVEEYLVQLDGTALRSNVLKAGHHGSNTSSSPIFIGYVAPEYAVFSRGCDNSYGHPHQEVIDTFGRFEIPTIDTCEEGTITFVSDGQTVVRR